MNSTSATAKHQPDNAIEVQLMRLWEQLLGVSPIGMEDNFFSLGGHSLLAVRMMAKIKQLFDRQLPIDVLWYGPGTIRHLANQLSEDGTSPLWEQPVKIKPQGSHPPLFCLPIAGGHLYFYDNIAKYIDPEQPVYGLPMQGVDGQQPVHTSIEPMAAYCIEKMRLIQPEGPYRMIGYCSGGVLAFEIARQLHARGESVAFLGVIDSTPPLVAHNIKWTLSNLFRRKQLRMVQERLYALFLNGVGLPHLRKLRGIGESHRWALWSYKPRPYAGRITLFRPADDEFSKDVTLGWSSLAQGGVVVHSLPGRHSDLVKEPGVQRLSKELNQSLAQGRQRQRESTQSRA